MSSEKNSKPRDAADKGKSKRSLAEVFAKAGLAPHAHSGKGKNGLEAEQRCWQMLTQDYEKIRKLLPPRASRVESKTSRKHADHPAAELIWDDLDMLHGTALPSFQYFLLARAATAELTYLWGRLCFTAAFDLARRQHGGVKTQPSPDKILRRGPLKWYLHWRRFYEQQGLTVHRANSDFLRIAFEVATGMRPAPHGFAAAWFLGALCQGHNKAPKRSLPHAFKRVQKLDLSPMLLGSKPEDDPKIPPIGLTAYPVGEKERLRRL